MKEIKKLADVLRFDGASSRGWVESDNRVVSAEVEIGPVTIEGQEQTCFTIHTLVVAHARQRGRGHFRTWLSRMEAELNTIDPTIKALVVGAIANPRLIAFLKERGYKMIPLTPMQEDMNWAPSAPSMYHLF